MGWEVSFPLLWRGLDVLATPVRGGWSHSPPVGKGGDVDDSVLCVGGGYGGCFCFSLIVLVTSFTAFPALSSPDKY